MNFENIKRKMEEELSYDDASYQIDLSRGKNNPVQKIRTNMKSEIIMQLICIIVFFAYPVFIEMHDFPQSVYIIFMFLICMMTIGYILKLSSFLKKTTDLTMNTRETIHQFIFEAKLTLEVYKTFIISGSLLLPIAVFAGYNGSVHLGDGQLFERWFNLNLNPSELLLLVVGYLVLAYAIYAITVWWANSLYGKYLNQLDNLIYQLNDNRADYV